MTDYLQTYSQFRPTQFDCRGLALPDRQDWYVAPVSQTRDSDCLEQSNFVTALASLGGESETVEVHRFGHWGPGWFEIILIDPNDEERVKKAEEIARSLEDYSILDETDLSRREHEAYLESWEHGECTDFQRALKREFELRDSTEDFISALPYDVLREFYESLIPCGDYWGENSSRVPYAVQKCTREDLAKFLAPLRKTIPVGKRY